MNSLIVFWKVAQGKRERRTKEEGFVMKNDCAPSKAIAVRLPLPLRSLVVCNGLVVVQPNSVAFADAECTASHWHGQWNALLPEEMTARLCVQPIFSIWVLFKDPRRGQAVMSRTVLKTREKAWGAASYVCAHRRGRKWKER